MNTEIPHMNITHELNVTRQAWEQNHVALLVADIGKRERLLFEEHRLEHHIQHVTECYHQMVINIALQKKWKQQYNRVSIDDQGYYEEF